MTTCVIMQPSYLPWIGYFDLVDQADVFVFLDNVQFVRRSWQQRNQIRTSTGLEWLSVPSRVRGRYHQLISDVDIVQPSAFPEHHIDKIEMNYAKSPYFNIYFPRLRELLNKGETSLCKLDLNIIGWLSEEFGLRSKFELSSVIGATGKRSELLVDICRKVNAKRYLSTIGSVEYLKIDQHVFVENDLELVIHNYHHPHYRQLFDPFIPYASAIDLLLNEGERSINIIREGRGPSLTLQEVIG
jgi:hypothetical protein